jgi:hypothetical protein
MLRVEGKPCSGPFVWRPMSASARACAGKLTLGKRQAGHLISGRPDSQAQPWPHISGQSDRQAIPPEKG